MSEVLYYSLPGANTSVKKYGSWSSKSTERNSFFVSTFDTDKRYYFRESNEDKSARIELGLNPNGRVASKAEYLNKVKSFIDFCKNDNSRKVVLSREKWTECSIEDAEGVFEILVAAYPRAFVYLIYGEDFGCWVGATPEKLLQGDSNNWSTMALAGSRSIDDRFEWTEKEINEQNIVSEYISNVLNQQDIEYGQSPRQTVQAGNIEHLSTEFIFSTDIDIYDLTTLLHPTPAVSGLPKEEAIQFINNNEDYDRKLYTGIIGCISPQESQLFVNLRCAQLFSNGILSYVGGGITKDSNPEKEWIETEFKSQTLLSVIQKM